MTIEGLPLSHILPGRIEPTGDRFDVCEDLLQRLEDIEEEYPGVTTGQAGIFILILYNHLLNTYLVTCEEAPSGGGGTGAQCERDQVEADETLVKFRIMGWGAYQTIKNQPFEKWYKFRCLIPVINADGTPNSVVNIITQKYKKKHLLDCDNNPCVGKWLELDQRIWKDWKLAEIKDVMQYAWFEDDDQTVNVSFSSTIAPPKLSIKVGNSTFEYTAGPSFTFSIAISHPPFLQLGTSEVFYCDPADSPGYRYDRPLYEMYVKHDN